MKNILFYLFILLIVSCTSTKVSNSQKTLAGEEWKVSDKDAPKIIARFKQCGLFRRCRKSAVIYENSSVKDYIIKTCPNAIISTVNARYRHADQKNYATLWGLNPKSDASKVRGYNTKILKVECLGKSNVSYYYYAKLCPPPKICPAPLDSL